MDARVDNHLGDSISYSINGVPLEDEAGNPTVPGFLNLEADGLSMDGITSVPTRWTLKLAKQYLPAGPKMQHRVTAAKLDNLIYRPGAFVSSADGAYWLMDLQRN